VFVISEYNFCPDSCGDEYDSDYDIDDFRQEETEVPEVQQIHE